VLCSSSLIASSSCKSASIYSHLFFVIIVSFFGRVIVFLRSVVLYLLTKPLTLTRLFAELFGHYLCVHSGGQGGHRIGDYYDTETMTGASNRLGSSGPRSSWLVHLGKAGLGFMCPMGCREKKF
jgi:hypothetical protein